MCSVVVAFLCTRLSTVAYQFGLRPMRKINAVQPTIHRLIPGGLFAKKKSLISDDLLASFDRFDEEEPEPWKGTTKIQKGAVIPPIQSKLISNDVLNSLAAFDDEDDLSLQGNKKGKQKHTKKVGYTKPEEPTKSGDDEFSIDPLVATTEIGDVVVPDGVAPTLSAKKSGRNHRHVDKPKEDSVRKTNPSARIRFAESAQRDFVSMGLEKVSLMYGNEVVLKDATFSVSTGERVGLVGPNGGGKVSRFLLAYHILLHMALLKI